jgi:hypothetical protein
MLNFLNVRLENDHNSAWKDVSKKEAENDKFND